MFESYIAVQRADVYSQHPDKCDRRINILDNLMSIYRHVIHEDHCITLRQLAIKGNDLHELGIPGGAVMGQLLNQLLEIVLDEPELNDKEVLKVMAMELYQKIR
jgi:tRNA nucleotidyltransferase (CCA-adding enzyme)